MRRHTGGAGPRHAKPFDLEIARLPTPVRTFPVQMIWSRRLALDPAASWLRARVCEVTKGYAGV